MLSYFDRYENITGKKMPDVTTLEMDQKCALAHQLRLSGESVMAIANYFGVSRQMVYKYLNKAKDERLGELENKTYLDIFVDRLYELESQRDYYRKIIDSLKSGGNGADVNLEKVAKRGHKKNLNMKSIGDLGKLVLQYDKLILDLEFAVGLIPRNNPENIYGKLSDRNKDLADDRELSEYNDDDLTRMLLEKLTKKSVKLGGNALKEVQNDRVL